MLAIAKTGATLLDLAFSTVRKRINIPAPLCGAPGPFALADLKKLKGSFCQAGFKDLKTETFQITFESDSPESYTRLHQQIATRIPAMLADSNDDVKKRVWNAITEQVWQYADSPGKS